MLIVILTANRDDLLQRCLTELLPATSADDHILVIDDSTDHQCGRLVEVTKSTATRKITYLDVTETFSFLSRECPDSALLWAKRICRRDIAALRNLALAVFAADEQQSVCALIDDDIIPRHFEQMAKAIQDSGAASFIAGPHIGGIDEMDTITRLQRICLHLHSLCGSTTFTPAEVLLQGSRVDFNEKDTMARQYGCVSAGCMFFDRISAFDFPFPPGYNEDWNWCLMRQTSGALIHRLPEAVEHAPHQLRPISTANLFFEIAGDVVLDVLRECRPPLCEVSSGLLLKIQAQITSTVAAHQVAGQALFEELHAIRLASDIARAAISNDEMAALFEICCNGSTASIVKHVEEWFQFFPYHRASFRRFLGDYINGPLGQLKEQIYAK